MRVRLLVVVVFVSLLSRPAFAQLPIVPEAKRAEAFAAVQKRFAGKLAAAADKKAVYKEMFEELIRDESLYPKVTAVDYRAALKTEAATYRKALHDSALELRESAVAPSANATATNPASNQLVERAAGTELISLAADLAKLFSADQSAITLNLNALGMFRGASTRDVDAGAQYFYSQRENWRRLTGSLTFGAKIPEKEITGLSGLPSADTLFDAFAWDVKYRLYGDRDPRASRWYRLFLGRLGTINELAATLPASPVVPAGDLSSALAAIGEVMGEELKSAVDQVQKSVVISGKFSGQHLTTVAGKNKYTGVALIEKGMGMLDLTGNATFSWADVPATEDMLASTTKNVDLSAALTGSILKNAIAANRSAELSASVKGVIPVDDTLGRKRIVTFNATLSLPFQEKAKIPLSFTYSNDPNSLSKEKHISGQIGFSYDFSALKSLLK